MAGNARRFYGLEVQREEHWIHTPPPTWSKAAGERLQGIFCGQTILMVQSALALDVIQVVDGCDELFNLAKVNGLL